MPRVSILRRIVLLAIVLAIAASASSAPQTGKQNQKTAPSRLKGMKAAIADLENGVLKQKEYPPLPYSADFPKFIELLKSDCRAEWEVVAMETNTFEQMAPIVDETGGYNDVMRAEIMHRFGRDIFEKLHQKAKDKFK